MLKRLEAKLAEVNAIPDVNRGGCGIVAKAIYDRVITTKPDTTIYYMMHKSYYNSLAYCKEILDTTVESPTHAVVKIGRYYYDSAGKYAKKELTKDYYLVPVTYEYITKALAKRGIWNSCFDRRNSRKIVRLLTN